MTQLDIKGNRKDDLLADAMSDPFFQNIGKKKKKPKKEEKKKYEFTPEERAMFEKLMEEARKRLAEQSNAEDAYTRSFPYADLSKRFSYDFAELGEYMAGFNEKSARFQRMKEMMEKLSEPVTIREIYKIPETRKNLEDVITRSSYLNETEIVDKRIILDNQNIPNYADVLKYILKKDDENKPKIILPRQLGVAA